MHPHFIPQYTIPLHNNSWDITTERNHNNNKINSFDLSLQETTQPIFAEKISPINVTKVSSAESFKNLPFKSLQNENLSQKESIKHKLTDLLSDYLQRIIVIIYDIFDELLAESDTRLQLAKSSLDIVSSLSNQLPKRFTKLVFLVEHMSPSQIEKYFPNLLKLFKKFIDNSFSDNDLKEVLIDKLVESLIPLIVPETDKEIEELTPSSSLPSISIQRISDNHKGLILAGLKGMDEFLKDLTTSMRAHSSFFKTSDYLALLTKLEIKSESQTSKPHQILEDSIISDMYASLRKKCGELNANGEVKNDPDITMFETNSILFDLLFSLSSLLPPKEKNALVNISALFFSKCVKTYFSPRTMLYIIDMALQCPLKIEQAQKRKELSLEEQQFAFCLDNIFQNLVRHGVSLGTTNKPANILLSVLIWGILKITKGEMGIDCVNSLNAAAHAPNKTVVGLNSLYNFLNRDKKKIDFGISPYPLQSLKQFSSENEKDFLKRRHSIEDALKENQLFEKINLSITNFFKNKPLKSESIANGWELFNKHTNILRSICGNASNALFAVSQSDKLLKMLYCYLGNYLLKELKSQLPHLLGSSHK